MKKIITVSNDNILEASSTFQLLSGLESKQPENSFVDRWATE
jgi:hypothetical protein